MVNAKFCASHQGDVPPSANRTSVYLPWTGTLLHTSSQHRDLQYNPQDTGPTSSLTEPAPLSEKQSTGETPSFCRESPASLHGMEMTSKQLPNAWWMETLQELSGQTSHSVHGAVSDHSHLSCPRRCSVLLATLSSL